MAGNNLIPERMVGFRVFNENKDLLGVANVTMPKIEAMTDTVSGAGIAGEVDSPVLGHYGSMTMTLNWRTVTDDVLALSSPGAHSVDIRGSMQVYDAGNAKYSTVPIRLVTRLAPKSTDLGTLDTGKATDTAQEFEVLYLKVFVDGKEKAEIDKFNYVVKFGDTDLLASVRSDLGLN